MTTLQKLSYTATHYPPTMEVVELFPRQGQWTERDYWPLSDRNRIIELSDGKLIVPTMPTTEHQDIVGNIYTALRAYVRSNKLGKIGIAPLPVRLWPGKVREPDVMVMLSANLDRVQNQYWGPPDLAIEVLSPGTAHTDQEEKSLEYAAAGVGEYWIVSAERRTVEVYRLDRVEDEVYLLDATYGGDEPAEIVSRIVPGFTLSIEDVFSTDE